MQLRFATRVDRLNFMPISMKFNLFLFKNDIRKAFQIDGVYASYLKEDLQLTHPGESENVIKKHLVAFLGNIAGEEVLIHDYLYGIFVVRKSTLRDEHGHESLDGLGDTEVQRIIGNLLDIPCTIVNWDLENNHQIAIEVNNEDFIVYMCKESDLMNLYTTVFKEFNKYREQADIYNKQVTNDLNKIHSVWLTFRFKTQEGGRDIRRTRLEVQAEDDFLAFMTGD